MTNGLLRCVAAWCLCAALAVSPAFAADMAKTLRVAYSIAETSFDPAFASDAASDGIVANIFDTMLDYDYLARPVRLVPRALAAMPVVEDGGKTYVCRIRKGIHFTPDPAFKGARRELTANDFAYALKRILDPAVKSPWLWLLEGKLVGGDEARAAAAANGRFDYDKALPGLEVVDRYTLRIRLTAPDLRFPYVLAVPTTSAQAREVVDAYGHDIGAHPVGTGPYMLGEYKRSSRIVLVANPHYRQVTYEPAGAIPESSKRTAPISERIRSARDRTHSASIGAARASCSSPTPIFAKRPTRRKDRFRRPRSPLRKRSAASACRSRAASRSASSRKGRRAGSRS